MYWFWMVFGCGLFGGSMGLVAIVMLGCGWGRCFFFLAFFILLFWFSWGSLGLFSVCVGFFVLVGGLCYRLGCASFLFAYV